MIKRLVELQGEIDSLYNEGVTSIRSDGIHISSRLWSKIAKGQEVFIQHNKNSEYPIETYFYYEGVRFFKIWELEYYLKREEKVNVRS